MKKFVMVVVALLFSFISVNTVFAAANTWTQKADFGGGARMAGAFSIGSKGYMGGGSSYDSQTNTSTPYKDFWEYDPSLNFWTRKSDFRGKGRYTVASFTVGNKGYTGTGWDQRTPYYKDLWEYDPLTDAWTQKANFPGTARQSAVGFAIDNYGYLGTGHDGANKYDFWQ